MIAVIDYGAGNIFSVENALRYLGQEHILTEDPDTIRQADAIILPGVGAFPSAMQMLHAHGLTELLQQQAKEKPFLGICLGMQMLFEKGYEFGETDGLGLIPGSVKLMHPAGDLPVPHIGWNSLEKNVPCKLLDRCADGEYVYFVHSFAAECDSSNVAAYCDYGMKVPALVFSGNVYGAQFHPEKSGDTGLNILRCFSEL